MALVDYNNGPSLGRAIEGGDLRFLYTQQAAFAKCAEDLKQCSTKDRSTLRRCQQDMMCVLKPLLILASECKMAEVRSQCFEALIQTTMGNTELAALMGSSGVFDVPVCRSLEPADLMGHSQEYSAGLTLELLVAKAVPEANVHLKILPCIARILGEGVQVELEVRQICVEILTHLCYTRNRCRDVAEVLSMEILQLLLERGQGRRDSAGTLAREASAGKALISDAISMSDQKRKSIMAVAGMDFSDNLQELKDHCSRASFSSGMRNFCDIVRRSASASPTSADCTSDPGNLANNMDGHSFNIGLLMANLCEMIVPGTNCRFGDWSERFWKRIKFFPGLDLCLSSALKGQPWPPLSDGDHQALHIVSTYVKLVSAGYARKMSRSVEPLVEAIILSSPDAVPQATANEHRIGRLASIALRGIIDDDRDARNDLLWLTQEKEKHGDNILDALQVLAQEEPAAGDLFAKVSSMTTLAVAPDSRASSRPDSGAYSRASMGASGITASVISEGSSPSEDSEEEESMQVISEDS